MTGIQETRSRPCKRRDQSDADVFESRLGARRDSRRHHVGAFEGSAWPCCGLGNRSGVLPVEPLPSPSASESVADGDCRPDERDQADLYFRRDEQSICQEQSHAHATRQAESRSAFPFKLRFAAIAVQAALNSETETACRVRSDPALWGIFVLEHGGYQDRAAFVVVGRPYIWACRTSRLTRSREPKGPLTAAPASQAWGGVSSKPYALPPRTRKSMFPDAPRAVGAKSAARGSRGGSMTDRSIRWK